MARLANFEILSTRKGWQVNVPAKYSSTGTRQRRYFPTQEEAQGFVQTLGVQITNYGLSAQLLKPTEAEQALAAMRLLRDAGSSLSLLDVARLHVASERRRTESRKLSEAIDAFLKAKKGRSEKYLDSLDRTKKRLAPLHGQMVSDITPAMIEELLTGLASSYRNALLREIRAIFGYAFKRQWCDENPVSRLDFESVSVGEREIYSTKEAARLLRTADKTAPELLPFVAIALFAGVRVYELLRLDWRHIDLEEKSIDLPAEITKRKRKRSIPIEAALHEWLQHDISARGIRSGPVVPFRTYNTLRKHLRALFTAARVTWRQNAARHSYASYWLAANPDLSLLSLYLGHVGGTAVLHQYYHRSVRRVEAEKYWGLTPREIQKPHAAVA